MPRKDKVGYREYMKEYMSNKRAGLTGINKKSMVGGTVRKAEPGFSN